MAAIYHGGVNYSLSDVSSIELTKSQYEALTPEQKSDPTKVYYVKDYPSPSPGPGPGGASSLDDLEDVDISNPTDGQYLRYDSTNEEWVNDDGPSPTPAVESLEELSDVNITTPTAGQVLTYDDTNDTWVNSDPAEETVVIANPVGIPTDELETIQIGNYIYDIAGGGSGGSGYEETVIYTASASEATYQLSKPLTDFDAIQVFIKYANSGSYETSGTFVTSNLVSGVYYGVTTDGWYTYFSVTDASTLTRQDTSAAFVNKIIGLKFGSGGSGGGTSAVETSSAEYDNLPQADKEDPSKIYFLNDTEPVEVTMPLDTSAFTYKIESSMSRTVVNGKIVWTYNGGSSIGACDYYSIAIPKEASAIKVKLTTGNSYSTDNERFKIGIGVKATYQNTQFVAPNDADWLAVTKFNTRNTTAELTIDLSEVNVNSYLMTSCHGWTVTFDEIGYVIETEPTGDTEIRYKNIPYGAGGSGPTPIEGLSAIETDSITYESLPQADKEDPDKLYFLNDVESSEVSIPLDTSLFTPKIESSMSRIVLNGEIQWTWTGYSQIGANDFYTIAIPKEAIAIRVKLTTGTCYETSRKIAVGIKEVYQTSNWVYWNDNNWLAVETFNTINSTGELEVDLSEVTVDSYLVLVCHGWTVTFSDLAYVIEGEVSSHTGIRYKDVPYGANAISDLSDIDLSSPADGHVLTYDATNSKWVNATPSGGTTVVANPTGTASTDLTKLQVGNDIYSIPSPTPYSLPIASANTLGGVKIGSTVSIDANGVLNLKPLNYSTTEQAIGINWIDGKPLYRVTYSYGRLPNAASTFQYHNISNIDTIIHVYGFASNGSTTLPLPYPAIPPSSAAILIDIGKRSVGVWTGTDRSDYTQSYITFIYTKTTD